ncbi:ABC transporter substrate-binding protein [Halobellus sp. Atlit-38R]|uniref:PhnD/SsuA/transferrin family substrate-binding protein n=1 Tax=Halobellus sp. Atlit-38R TaxID=2282131 RepID=UPI000EF1D6B6|nr:PhnD/SsuA/transferrin family substrate-binding protein [Halobellus sp. Atlit-38R]RLM84268.1 ABC transporter substrate-binding protein [Halobellus sp. Atlit-38R]
MTVGNISLACNLTDRTRAIYEGQVRPTGVDLNFLPYSVEEVFFRMLRYEEFDAAEMSMSSYMMTVDRENPDLIAIPVFPSRFFRHSCIFVNTNAGIEGPADLRGKKVGVPEYQMTSPLWIRGMLQHEYGVSPEEMHWYHGGEEEGGREEKLSVDLPTDVDLSSIEPDETLSAMLGRGDLDALLTARTPSSYSTSSVERLWQDYRSVERDYYKRTGFFPIMHTIVLRGDVYRDNPWLAQELTKVFTEAKEVGLDRLRDTSALQTSLPWQTYELESTVDLMGDNYWPYGVDANRSTLEAMTQYSYEQGLTNRKLSVEELFAPETVSEFKV